MLGSLVRLILNTLRIVSVREYTVLELTLAFYTPNAVLSLLCHGSGYF